MRFPFMSNLSVSYLYPIRSPPLCKSSPSVVYTLLFFFLAFIWPQLDAWAGGRWSPSISLPKSFFFLYSPRIFWAFWKPDNSLDRTSWHTLCSSFFSPSPPSLPFSLSFSPRLYGFWRIRRPFQRAGERPTSFEGCVLGGTPLLGFHPPKLPKKVLFYGRRPSSTTPPPSFFSTTQFREICNVCLGPAAIENLFAGRRGCFSGTAKLLVF